MIIKGKRRKIIIETEQNILLKKIINYPRLRGSKGHVETIKGFNDFRRK